MLAALPLGQGVTLYLVQRNSPFAKRQRKFALGFPPLHLIELRENVSVTRFRMSLHERYLHL